MQEIEIRGGTEKERDKCLLSCKRRSALLTATEVVVI